MRSRENGGLGLHNIRHKRKAMLCRAFMETAADPKYKHSAYHEALYKSHVLEEDDFDSPPLPPYYSESFINDIKEAVGANLPIETMTSKGWYEFFISKDRTT